MTFCLAQTVSDLVSFPLESSEFDKSYPKDSFDTKDPNNCPVESILRYCCGILDESRSFAFSLEGFESTIRLPVCPELSIVLSQLGDVVAPLRGHVQEASIDLFEQGYEIEVQFRRTEVLHSVSIDATWKNSHESFRQTTSLTALRAAIARLIVDFTSAVTIVAPSAVKEPAFAEWLGELLWEGND